MSCLAISTIRSKCQICSQPAHGNHFGAITCRACSAFFRRTAIHEKLPSKCKSSPETCQLVDGRWICKYCRYRKCIDVGMSPNKFQYDRDAISGTSNYEIDKMRRNIIKSQLLPESMEKFIGRPAIMMTFEPELAATGKKRKLDIQFLEFKIKNILKTVRNRENSMLHANDLKVLTNCLKRIRKNQRIESMKVEILGQKEFFWMAEYHTTVVATWLSYLDDYHQLSSDIKYKIFKRVWACWTRLERVSYNAQIRGKNMKSDQQFTNSDHTVIALNKPIMDCSWFSNYSNEKLIYLMENMDTQFQNELFDPIVELKPTDTEITFLLAHLVFREAANYVDLETAMKLEKIVEKLANDLHEYYINEENNPRYSHRLSKLLKIGQVYENYSRSRKEKIRLANVFNVFNIELSDPEMFEDMC